MREIKFRAWDIVTKKYFVTGFHILGEANCFNLIEQYLYYTVEERRKYHNVNDEGYYIENGIKYNFCLLSSLNDVIIEQFTGMIDKKGKEIYEGDIISNGEIRHKIRYENTIASFVGDILIKNNYMQYCSINQNWINEFQKEVVGNIHENPEMLEDL
jgi:uncharacterized phage protein (TIGR01671 family)